MLKLDSLPASNEARTLTVSAALDTEIDSIQCHNVLIGEVWICLGQSNMAYATTIAIVLDDFLMSI